MCEQDKLNIRNQTVDWTSIVLLCYIGYPSSPSQSICVAKFHGSGPHSSLGSSSSGGSTVRSLVFFQGGIEGDESGFNDFLTVQERPPCRESGCTRSGISSAEALVSVLWAEGLSVYE
ncbi:hypothetical protein CDAR_216441 [Caerostris darwini]|uniref:Uncharacterized protein n=1 Tax=Caerostris darwini TaxID=1538125 RepID=A0AAV4UB00_9ARAC|nr:hypothetical protein CDAR_216441 [Caerostris darwini]